MAISYNKLWKLLIDRSMNKRELRLAIGVSSAVIAKMGKNEPVNMAVLIKICQALQCNIGDIVDYIPEHKAEVAK